MIMPVRPAAASDADYARLCVAHAAWQAAITALHAALAAPGPEREAQDRAREQASTMRTAFRDYQFVASSLGTRAPVYGASPPEHDA